MKAHQTFLHTTDFGSLDGLRCLSILAVVWHHAGTANGHWRGLGMGFLGVDLFFVISGFLIVTLLLREQRATGNISLKKFYARRTLRIFPLYYAVIFALVGLYALHGSKSGTQFLRELPIYLTYTANFYPVSFGIVWSLAAEEQFYLLWPSIEKYFRALIVPLLVALIALNQWSNFPDGRLTIAHLLDSDGFPSLSIAQTTFTPILLGVAAAHLLDSERGFYVLRLVAGKPWAAVLWLAMLVILITLAPADISGMPRLGIQLCMTFLVIGCVRQENNWLRPLLAFAPVQRIGKISYGMYLLHLPVVSAARLVLHTRPDEGSVELYVATLAVTVLVSELSFRFFESPILRLKRKYSVVHQRHV